MPQPLYTVNIGNGYAAS